MHYSQTGQLGEIADKFCSGLRSEDVRIDYLRIDAVPAFPYPWNRLAFFNTFPESVFGIPMPIKTSMIDESIDYDLVVLAYTIWYMAPSIPINSFLQSEQAKTLLNGKKVVTLIGARNMWVVAQERMKFLLKGLNAQLIGNIALVDRNSNLISIVTIIRWMFYGKKDPFWGFPRAGILQKDIDGAEKFGEIVNAALADNQTETLNKQLLENGAVTIDPALLILEKRASKIFKLYGNFIRAKGEYDDPARLGRVSLLSYLIPIGAFVLSPITAIASYIISKVKRKEVEAEIERLKQCD
ncbi:MAG: hypothetical protein ACI9FU_002280 [Granulosicoccus sp.]